MSELSDDDVRLYGLYEGEVIDVEDPKAQKRVRARLLRARFPIDDTGWLMPLSAGGGGPQRGGIITPKVGSRVLVQFIDGQLEAGVWMSGGWSTPEGEHTDLPNDISRAGDEAHLVQALEVNDGKYSLRVTVDERDGHRAFRLYAVAIEEDKSETTIAAIVFDLEDRGVSIYGLTQVAISSAGTCSMKGIVNSVAGRPVRTCTGAPV